MKKKKFIFCCYYGTDYKKLNTRIKGTQIKITCNAVKQLKHAQQTNKVYFMKMCPACRTIIEII